MVKIQKAEVIGGEYINSLSREMAHVVIERDGSLETVNMPFRDQNGKVIKEVYEVLELASYYSLQRVLVPEEVKRFDSLIAAAKEEVAKRYEKNGLVAVTTLPEVKNLELNEEVVQKKKGFTVSHAIVGVAAFGLAMLALRGCDAKMFNKTATAVVDETDENINETDASIAAAEEITFDTDIDKDAVRVTIDYDKAINEYKAFYKDINDALEKNQLNNKIDKKSVLAYYLAMNAENIDDESLARIVADYNVPTDGKGFVLAFFPTADLIGQIHYDYMIGKNANTVDISPYFVDGDAKALATKVLDDSNTLRNRYDSEDYIENKKILMPIYDDIYNYEVNNSKSSYGNYNEFENSYAYIVDLTYTNENLQVLGNMAIINQKQINDIVGTHKDPGTGELINNTNINYVGDIMGQWEHHCATYTYNDSKTR